MAEIRVWGIAGSGALIVSDATENDAVPVLYPDISHDGTNITIMDHKSPSRSVRIEPFGDFRQKGGTVITVSQTMLDVIEYLLTQRGL